MTKTGMNTVLIMAAGTGGHVFPALAVAKQLQARGIAVHWLATPAGMENRLLADEAITMHRVNIQGVRGNGIKRLLAAPFRVMSATVAAMRIMRRHHIGAVAGFGGYVAAPGGLAARLLGLPLVLHEQNAIAGMTNRQLARFATRVLQAFPHTFAASSKVITTGNPVRAEISRLDPPAQRYGARDQAPLSVLVIGGSLGAQALNECVPAALHLLDRPLRVWHQCGQAQLATTQQRYASLANSQLQVEVVAFVQDMAQAYARADLIICRAGALTVTEVASAGLAAVFVPLPSAVDDHQTANARYLADKGAAVICPQSALSPAHLSELLKPLMHRPVLLAMAQKARQQAQHQATEQVVDILLSLLAPSS